jgi:hypothetical protein
MDHEFVTLQQEGKEHAANDTQQPPVATRDNCGESRVLDTTSTDRDLTEGAGSKAESDGTGFTLLVRKPLSEAYLTALLETGNCLKNKINTLYRCSEPTTISHPVLPETIAHVFDGESLDCQSAYLVIAHFTIMVDMFRKREAANSEANQKASEDVKAHTQAWKETLSLRDSTIVELRKEVDRQKKMTDEANSQSMRAIENLQKEEGRRICAEANVHLARIDLASLKSTRDRMQARHEKYCNEAVSAQTQLKEARDAFEVRCKELSAKSE